MFEAKNFPTTKLVGKDAVQHVIDNVYMFQERYDVNLGYMYVNRTSLRYEDESLFYDIYKELCAYLGVEEDSDKGDELFDSVEEIFG